VVLEMRLVDIVIFMTLEANDIARLSYVSKPNASLFNFVINFAKTIVLRCNSQPLESPAGRIWKDQQAVYLCGNS
jgi:hypothetical protein